MSAENCASAQTCRKESCIIVKELKKENLLGRLCHLQTANKIKDHPPGVVSPSNQCTSHNHNQCPYLIHSAQQNGTLYYNCSNF